MRLKTYNFPGWKARIDGRPAAMSNDSDGIQTISVQPGVHKIEVWFGSTPPRMLGAALTMVAMIAIAALIAFEFYHKRREANGITSQDAAI